MTTHSFHNGDRIPVLASRHTNPDGSQGGWVAATAIVASTVYIAPTAEVFDQAQVTGHVKIFDNAKVFAYATVKGHAILADDARIAGRASIYGDAYIGGNAFFTGYDVAHSGVHYGNDNESSNMVDESDRYDIISIEATKTMTRKFGIEIELVGTTEEAAKQKFIEYGIPVDLQRYNHVTATSWKIVPDGSLTPGGFEVVSPILEGEAGIAEVRKVAKLLVEAGAKVDNSCGFHVHVNARDLSVDSIVNTAARYNKFEDDINKFMPKSRHESRWCRPVSEIFNCYDIPYLLRQGTRVFGSINRYHKINLAAYARHGTIEFRQHAGTVNATKMEQWVRFCLEFVDASVVAETTEFPVRRRAVMRESTRLKIERLYNKFHVAGINVPLRVDNLCAEFNFSESTLRSYCVKIKELYGRKIRFSHSWESVKRCWLLETVYSTGPAPVRQTSRRVALPVIADDWVFNNISTPVAEYYFGRALDLAQKNAEQEERINARAAEREIRRARRIVAAAQITEASQSGQDHTNVNAYPSVNANLNREFVNTINATVNFTTPTPNFITEFLRTTVR